MPLTQDQRIEISKKVIEIPKKNEGLDLVKENALKTETKLINEDEGNKSIMDEYTPFIDKYQDELTQLDGNLRLKLTEQDMIDSANRKKPNFFFPLDPNIPTPNIPDGVWKNLSPFSGSIAIGKKYNESYDIVTKEQDIIDNIEAQITIIEGFNDATRSTGLEGVSGTPDTFVPEAVIQQALLDIVQEVNSWRSFLVNQKTYVVLNDPNATKQAQNNASIASIDAAIALIDSWLVYDDFDTTSSLPSGSGGAGVALFDALLFSYFQPSKLRATELQIIKDSIANREAQFVVRIPQLQANLGTVGQNLTTGVVDNTGSGLFDKRFKVINLRLTLLGGSLNKRLSIAKTKDAQDSFKLANDQALDLYASVMSVSAFRAPAANTGTIHIGDESFFIVGDAVYVVADNQLEISANVLSVSDKVLVLDVKIPEKYTHNNAARVYKIL